MAQTIASKFPNGVPKRKVRPVRVVVPSQQLHTLVGTNRSLQSAVAAQGAQNQADPAAQADQAEADIVACVKDKQDLTDKIIAARQAARVARTDRMSAEGR